MKDAQQFPAKLLLFGEYAVLRGGQALAVPYPSYHGQWDFQAGSPPDLNLLSLADYIQASDWPVPLDLPRFREDIRRGLYFNSTIPIGYGLGSSGALIAAFFATYGPPQPPADMVQLRTLLARLESCFHGTSSGTDPLICYLQEAFQLEGTSGIRQVETPANNPLGTSALFLLDTGHGRETGPLVRYFSQQCTDPGFVSRLNETLLPANAQAIMAYLAADWPGLHQAFQTISTFQSEYFTPMIPNTLQSYWKSDVYQLKLCGAGGGGFMLGITENWLAASTALANFRLEQVHAFSA